MKHKTCDSCALCDENKNICMRFGIFVNPDEDFCSWWVSELLYCAKCNRPMVSRGSIVIDNEVYCPGCARGVE